MAHTCTAALIRCMDFRLTKDINNWLESQGLVNDCDIISLAGAAKDIVDNPNGFLMNQIALSVKLHQTKKIYILQHMDCGAYGGHTAFIDETEELKKYQSEMAKATEIILSQYPQLEIVLGVVKRVEKFLAGRIIINNKNLNTLTHTNGRSFMSKMTESDRELVRQLRKAGILEDLETNPEHKMEEGAIVVPCADGDQRDDIFRQLAKIAQETGAPNRFHGLSLNGGALLLSPGSPLLSRLFRVDGSLISRRMQLEIGPSQASISLEDKLLLIHLEESVIYKGIKTIVLYTHAPCGAVEQYNRLALEADAKAKPLTLWHQINMLVSAKIRLKEYFAERIPGIKVACFVHIDDGKRKRTYFISMIKWLKYIAKNNKLE